MNGIRLGLQFRGLRVHKDLRQQDVGRLAGVSRAVISRVERGLVDNLGPAADRGWEVAEVARLLVVGESATSRRRVERLAATYQVAYPIRGRAVLRWLREPDGPISGLLFLAYAPQGSARRSAPGRQRVRKRRPRRARTKASDYAPPGSDGREPHRTQPKSVANAPGASG